MLPPHCSLSNHMHYSINLIYGHMTLRHQLLYIDGQMLKLGELSPPLTEPHKHLISLYCQHFLDFKLYFFWMAG